MTEEEKRLAYKELEKCEKRLIQLMEDYDKLLDRRYELLPKACFSKLRSYSDRKDYITSIRLLYSTYVYDCGMLNEYCTKLILSLDGVLSFGDPQLRQSRKSLVLRVQSFQVFVERLVVRSKSLQNWFKTHMLDHAGEIERIPPPKRVRSSKSTDYEPPVRCNHL